MSMSLTSIFLPMGTQGLGRVLGEEQWQQLLRPRRTPTASPQLWQRPVDTQRPGSPSSSSRSNITAPLWAQTHPRPRSRVRPEVLGVTLQRQSQQVPMSHTRPSAFLTTVLPSPHWPPGLSLLNMLTTRPQGHTMPTPARPQGCIQPSLTWGPPRGPCTRPSPTQRVYRSRTAPHTGNSLSTQHCRGHDRQRDQRALVQVQPPCLTQGAAAATTAVLVVLEVKVVWAGGSGQAPGKEAGEAGGEKPQSDLSQMQKCFRSLGMSLQRGVFEVWLIIWGAQCSSQRVCYFDGAKKKHSPTTAEFQVRFTAAKPLAVQTTRLAVFIGGKGSCPHLFGDSLCIRDTL